MVDFALESEVYGVEIVDPRVAGDLVSALPPNILLFVESRLVWRKVLKMDPGVALDKELHLHSFMPVGSVNIEMDGIASERTKHMPEDEQESLAVATGGAYETLPAQQWRHPPGQIEPFSVLTGSGHFEAFTSFGPPSSKTRMETETRFILKDNRFISFELGEFFLTRPENPRRPWREPASRRTQPASDCSLSDATSTAPVAPSVALQNPASDESPESAHPRQLALCQSLAASSPNRAVAADSARMSVGPCAPAVAWVPKPVPRLDLYHLPSVPESCDSDRARCLPLPEVGPPKPTASQRSLVPSMHLEAASPVPTAPLWSPLGALLLKLS